MTIRGLICLSVLFLTSSAFAGQKSASMTIVQVVTTFADGRRNVSMSIQLTDDMGHVRMEQIDPAAPAPEVPEATNQEMVVTEAPSVVSEILYPQVREDRDLGEKTIRGIEASGHRLVLDTPPGKVFPKAWRQETETWTNKNGQTVRTIVRSEMDKTTTVTDYWYVNQPKGIAPEMFPKD